MEQNNTYAFGPFCLNAATEVGLDNLSRPAKEIEKNLLHRLHKFLIGL